MQTTTAQESRLSTVSNKLKIGVLVPTRGLQMTGEQPRNIDGILSMAEAAETAGLDSVWVGDNLTTKSRLEPLTTLAAVAKHTNRVRLGTAVLLAALRQPVLLAQTLGTLDLVSGGRVVLAVGVGSADSERARKEWRNAGVDPSRRAGRLEEIVDIVKRLTMGEEVSYQGRHFNLDSLSIEPRSVQPDGVPILIACHFWRGGTRRDIQFKRAARLGDGFISLSDYPEEYAQVKEEVRGYAKEVGKDFSRMEAAFYMTVNLDRDEERAAEEADRFFDLYYFGNRWGDRWGPYGAPERTVERIRRYAEAGAGTIIVRFASLDPKRQLGRFLDEVVPALRSDS